MPISPLGVKPRSAQNGLYRLQTCETVHSSIRCLALSECIQGDDLGRARTDPEGEQ